MGIGNLMQGHEDRGKSRVLQQGDEKRPDKFIPADRLAHRPGNSSVGIENIIGQQRRSRPENPHGHHNPCPEEKPDHHPGHHPETFQGIAARPDPQGDHLPYRGQDRELDTPDQNRMVRIAGMIGFVQGL